MRFQAWRHSAEAHTWVTHQVQGRGLALRAAQNPPLTAWIRPAGLRGTVDLEGVSAMRAHLVGPLTLTLLRAIRVHNAAVSRLPPHFTAADAIAAGLPGDVGEFRPQRTAPIPPLIEAVLLLTHDTTC